MYHKKVIAIQQAVELPIQTLKLEPETASSLYKSVKAILLQNNGEVTDEGIQSIINELKKVAPEIVQALEALNKGRTKVVLLEGFKFEPVTLETPSPQLLSQSLRLVTHAIGAVLGRLSHKATVNVTGNKTLGVLDFHMDNNPARDHFTVLMMAGLVKAKTFFARGSQLLRHLAIDDLERLSQPIRLEYCGQYCETPLLEQVNGTWVFHSNFEDEPDAQINPFMFSIDKEHNGNAMVESFERFLDLEKHSEYATLSLELDRGDCVIFDNSMTQNPVYHGRGGFNNHSHGRTFCGAWASRYSLQECVKGNLAA